jgi:hypothetical protein
MMSAAVMTVQPPARLDDGIVLGITTTFWLSFLSAAPARWTESLGLLFLVCAAALATALILAIVLAAARPPELLRGFLAVWSVVAMLYLGIVHFPLVDLEALRSSGRVWLMILAATYVGVHVALLAQNALVILVLVPIPTRGISLEQRLRMSEKLATALADSYAPEPIPWARAAFIVAFQAVLVALLRSLRPDDVGMAILLASTVLLVPRAAARPAFLPTTGDVKRAERATRARPAA